MSPDGKLLFVADAGENAVAVIDIAHRAVLGFIPTAWYPADVQITPDGRHLVVADTYGFGARPNPAARSPHSGPRAAPITDRTTTPGRGTGRHCPRLSTSGR